jgi:hypothetical protein
MTFMKQIKIHIRPDGQVQAETYGIKGKACIDYIKVLEELLDAEAVESSYKPEYFESEEPVVKIETADRTVDQLGLEREPDA